jgi:hypothetical protein
MKGIRDAFTSFGSPDTFGGSLPAARIAVSARVEVNLVGQNLARSDCSPP